MASSVLSLDAVGVRRRGRVIVDDVTFACEEGTVTVIRGANGSGKSTLLGVVTGLMEPSWGKVVSRSRSVSYLPELFNPPSGMDVSTYLRWIAGTRGIPRRARENAVSAPLTALGFTGSMGPMRLLSKGNLQRVGIAGALLGMPGLIVLDEPFTGMDGAGTELVSEALAGARAEGSTLLVVHHGATPFSASQSLRLANGALFHGLKEQSPARYLIRASSTGAPAPALPQGATVMGESKDRLAISTSTSAVTHSLDALLDAGWMVNGVERE